ISAAGNSLANRNLSFSIGYVVSLVWGEAGSPQSQSVMALRIVVAASACIKWSTPSLLAFRCPSQTYWKYRGSLRNPESCTREHGGKVCNSLRGRRFVEERTRLERETGIEPATSSLGSLRSTAELLPLATSTLPQRGGQHRSRARNSTHDILKALVVTARRAVSGGKIASRAHNFIIGSCRIGVGLGPGGTGAVAGCIFRPERCECAPGSAEHSKARRGRFSQRRSESVPGRSRRGRRSGVPLHEQQHRLPTGVLRRQLAAGSLPRQPVDQSRVHDRGWRAAHWRLRRSGELRRALQLR